MSCTAFVISVKLLLKGRGSLLVAEICEFQQFSISRFHTVFEYTVYSLILTVIFYPRDYTPEGNNNNKRLKNFDMKGRITATDFYAVYNVM